MFVTGMNPFLGSVFTFTTLLIAIPSAVKAFNYITTLWKGNIQFNPPMLFAIAFVSTFITGGLTGIILGDSALDINVHDTYFVVAHFHIVMGSASFFGLFAGVYHWFPKMFGRMMDETLGKIHFWGTIIPFNGIFLPLFLVGMAGQHRRIYNFQHFPDLATADLQGIRVFATVSMVTMLLFQFVFAYNFFVSMFKGEKAPANPWKSNTLEWTVPSPPPHGNFAELPTVYRGPYEYSVPGNKEDYWPQNMPDRN